MITEQHLIWTHLISTGFTVGDGGASAESLDDAGVSENGWNYCFISSRVRTQGHSIVL